MSLPRQILTALCLSASISLGGTAAFAQTAPVEIAAKVATSHSGEFIKRKKRLKGNWEVVQRDGKSFISLSDDFKAQGGPDLKIFLSPKTYANVTGKTATDGALNLGELVKNKGAQEYEIPAGTNLDDFQSILVHCEAYAVLWGGSDF